MSTESGRGEVYVAPFLEAGGRTRVSVDGGRAPRWSRDGRALYYISGKQELVRVPVTGTSPLGLGAPAIAFSASVADWITYDVVPDRRFLALVAEMRAGTAPWTIQTNWMDAAVRR